MKRLYTLLAAGVMIAALAMPVIAAPSPEADTITPVTIVTTNVSNVSMEEPSQAMMEEVIRVTSNAQVLKDLNVPSSAHLAAVVMVDYSGTIPAGGVQIPFNVSKFAKKGDMVYILHRRSYAPYSWEVVGQSVLGNDLTVTGTFKSFSPVVFMVVDASEVTAAGVKSPKTGEF